MKCCPESGYVSHSWMYRVLKSIRIFLVLRAQVQHHFSRKVIHAISYRFFTSPLLTMIFSGESQQHVKINIEVKTELNYLEWNKQFCFYFRSAINWRMYFCVKFGPECQTSSFPAANNQKWLSRMLFFFPLLFNVVRFIALKKVGNVS